MARGLSLNIGLNAVDPKHYQGWDGRLNACEFDANDMAAIARAKRFTANTLLTSQAKRQTVLDAVKAAAKELQDGDISLLTYSGHGGQLPDLNDEEADHMDETWCLFDGAMLDDELYAIWSEFKKGVRVLVFSDGCHSGTVTKEVPPMTAFSVGRASHGERSRPNRSVTRRGRGPDFVR